MVFRRVFAAGVLAVGLAAGQAPAMPVDPTIGTEGDLSLFGTDVTFGGSGIPTSPANIGQFTDSSGNTLLLGILATPRFSAPAPVSDGDGTYSVQPGVDGGGRSLWNFSFYAELFPAVSSSLVLADIGLSLFYDLDPGAGTDVGDMGEIQLSALLGATAPSSNISQGSQNATFGYLSAGAPGVIAPVLSAFNPNAGEYSFLLSASGFTAEAATGIGMNVNVVPIPATLGFLLAGIGALGLVARRKRGA